MNVVQYHLPVLITINSMTGQISQKNNVAFYVFAVFCMFFYIYQSNLLFLGLPFISTSVQLSWILMATYALFLPVAGKNTVKLNMLGTYKKWTKHVKIFLVLFLYSLFLLFIVGKGEGDNISETVLKIFIYGISIFWIWARMFRSLDDFMRVLLITGIIQSLFIIYCLINPTFALILDATVNFNPTIDELSRHAMFAMREDYAGGIGCITSSGLIKYTLTGMIPCVYFCIKKEGLFYLLIFLLMAFCAAMLARTGLIYDIILASFIIVKRLRGRAAFPVVIAGIVAFAFLSNLFTSTEHSSFVEERFSRYENLKDGGTQDFFESYFYGANAHYPPINSDTFWGVGVTSGKSANGYEVNVDGGPMRQYSAIGLLGCLLFYFFVLSNQIRTIKLINNKNYRHLLWLLFVCLIIGEWKEVTYMAFWPLPLFFYMSFLLQFDEKKIIQS